MNYKQTLSGGIIAFLLATSCCWIPWIAIILGGASGLASFGSGLEKYSSLFMVSGLGFLVFGVVQYRNNHERDKKSGPNLKSIITCPKCGHMQEEEMPTDACQFFYECTNCKVLLKPRKGDCCVFCSYGTVPCPPIQSNTDCC